MEPLIKELCEKEKGIMHADKAAAIADKDAEIARLRKLAGLD